MATGDKWFVPGDISTAALLEMVDKGQIALPEFQRKFRWSTNDIAELLRSVARNWPAGTFLLLEVGDEPPFGHRKLEKAPDLHKPKLLLLDGQQRTTALYIALRGTSTTTYYVDVDQVRSEGEFDDEHLKYMRTTTFLKKYPGHMEQAEAGLLPVATLADEKLWDRWLSFYSDVDVRDEIIELKNGHLSGLVNYSFPTNRLARETELAAIARIFETINRRGQRLDAFDLMVARLYPHHFRLRDEWDSVLEGRAVFKRLGATSGLEVLQLIALREHLRQRQARASDDSVRVKVKGVRQSDLLELDPLHVKEAWSAAVDAYERALIFLESHCGVVRSNLVPQSTMFLALADVMFDPSVSRDHLERDLQRWFWASCFSQTYGEGANTRVISDVETLRAWVASGDAVPAVVQKFKSSEVDLLESRDRNRILARALMARLVAKDARDWKSDNRFQAEAGPVDFHHVIPDDMMAKHYVAPEGEPPLDEDPIAGFAPLLSATNKSLRDKRPSDVVADPEVRDSAISTHLIDLGKFKAVTPDLESIREFLEWRSAELRTLMDAAVNNG